MAEHEKRRTAENKRFVDALFTVLRNRPQSRSLMRRALTMTDDGFSAAAELLHLIRPELPDVPLEVLTSCLSVCIADAAIRLDLTNLVEAVNQDAKRRY